MVAVPEQPVLLLQLRAPLLRELQVGLHRLQLTLEQLHLGGHGVGYLPEGNGAKMEVVLSTAEEGTQ
jgi:hypothetical protein